MVGSKIRGWTDGEGEEVVGFFAYLEEVIRLPRRAVIDAPDGALLVDTPLAARSYRARFSAIRFASFDPLAQAVTLVGSGPISDIRRNERRAGLNRAFESMPVPIIDLFWRETDRTMRDRRRRTLPGRWFELVARQGLSQESARPVLVGESDPGALVDDFGAGALVRLSRVRGQRLSVLRDIFSLAHLPDDDFDEGPGGAGGAPPPDDGDPPQKGTVTIGGPDEGQEAEEAELERARIVWESEHRHEDEDPLYVTVSL